MNLSRILSYAIARRLAYVLVAIILAWLGAGRAYATDIAPCLNTGSCDEGEAYVLAYASGNAATDCEPLAGSWIMVSKKVETHSDIRKSVVVTCSRVSDNYTVVTTNARRWYYGSRVCATRNELGAMRDVVDYRETPGMSCVAGCKVQGVFGSTMTGGVQLTTFSERSYNGDTCNVAETDSTVPVPPPAQDKIDNDKSNEQPPECVALEGGQTGCVKPDGDYCATASTGKTFCWTPAEQGEKVDVTEAQTKTKKGDPVTPPEISIPEADWQRREGHQTVNCVNDTCTTNNITNFTSVPAGTAKNSTGDNESDGSGNTSGNGTKPDGESEGDGTASGGGDCKAPPTCSGDAIQCSQLSQQWRIACSTSKSDEDGNGVSDVLEGRGEIGDGGTDEKVTRFGLGVKTDMLDKENIFGGGSCPVFPSFQIMKVTISPSDIPQWCSIVSIMRAAILIMGAFAALQILMGKF